MVWSKQNTLQILKYSLDLQPKQLVWMIFIGQMGFSLTVLNGHDK